MFYGTTTQQSQALKWFVEVITYYQDWARAKAVQHNATRLGGDNENNRWKPPPQGTWKCNFDASFQESMNITDICLK